MQIFKTTQTIKRIAVVIGNSEYQNLLELPTATNDAEAIQKTLRSLEFEVTYGTNLSRDEMLKCFSSILDSWDHKAKEIVFYYSGRAISSNDKVYLAPYDAGINLPETLTKSFLDVDMIINVLLNKRKGHSVPVVVILNCHRSLLKSNDINNHYYGHPLQKVSKEIGVNRNIAILYSMTEDEIAIGENDEQVGNKLSLFAQILLENMKKDWTINRIHSTILQFLEDSGKINDREVPWLYQSLFESYKFCLMPYDHAKDPFYGVPPSNQNFVDRPKIFAEIDTIFAVESDRRRILALQGLGGTGKTQIMLQYCYIHHVEYNFTFWLEMENRTVALESFSNLAINLGLDVESEKETSDDMSIIKMVSSWLENKTKWLLLLNNVDEEMTKFIFTILPRFGGDIIITTREPIPKTKAKIVHVPKMEEDEALALLYGATAVNQESLQYQYAKEIISELDSLPLAVDLARAYTDTMSISFKDYLKMFRNQRDRAEIFLHRDEDNAHQYNHSLASVWKISFDRIKIESPMAVVILNACSFLKSELIPVRLFEEQHWILGDGLDLSFSSSEESSNSWKKVRVAIAILVKFSLATRTLNEDQNRAENPASDTLTIHRLVQKVIYDAMSKEEKTRLIHDLSSALRCAMGFRHDSDSSYTQTVINAYFLHICHFSKMIDISQKEFISKELFELMRQTVLFLLNIGVYLGVEELAHLTLLISESIHEPESEPIARSLTYLARVYYYQGNYGKAEPLFERALVISKKAFGPEHPFTTASLNNLAMVYKAQGDYKKAKPLYERALAIQEKVSGLEHPETAVSLNNLATLYKYQGNYDKAQPLYEQALVIATETLGHDDLFTATSLNNLAGLYEDQGNYGKAEPLYERSLVIFEKTFGHEHPSTATSLNNLAGLYENQGNYGKAEPLYEQALVIREKALGPEHPETATSLNNLATLHYRQGNHGKVEFLYKRALLIREKALGSEHPEMAESLQNLAELYKNQGKYDKAELLNVQALMIKKKALGPEHPSTAVTLNNLAMLYFNRGNYDKAKPLYERALAIREKALGHEHLETAKSLNNLAELYLNQGNYGKAKQLYEQALVIEEKVLGPEHPEMATPLNNLAMLYLNQGNYDKAKPLCERALVICENVLGPEHQETATSLNNLGGLYFEQKNYDKAELLFERALVILEKALGPEHLSTAASLSNLAMVYENQKNYSKAESLYERTLMIREYALGPEHPETTTSLNNLAELYFSQGNYNKAKPLYKRALVISKKVLGSGHPKTVICQMKLMILSLLRFCSNG